MNDVTGPIFKSCSDHIHDRSLNSHLNINSIFNIPLDTIDHNFVGVLLDITDKNNKIPIPRTFSTRCNYSLPMCP